jgi:hypothetical protein
MLQPEVRKIRYAAFLSESSLLAPISFSLRHSDLKRKDC